MKLHQPWNFKNLGHYNISIVKQEIEKISREKWQEDSSRQKTFIAHKHTETIFVFDFPLMWYRQGYPSQQVLGDSLLLSELKKIILDLEQKHNGRVGRCIITKLAPGGVILPHQDSGFYLENSHRHHIPIKTNNQVLFTVNDETISMTEGSCYEINNSKLHSVSNNSPVDRIHIIIDIIPNELFILAK